MSVISQVWISVSLSFNVLLWRWRYRSLLKRIRGNATRRERLFRVAFLVSDCAKWKCQSLYDLMKEDSAFEPFVVLTHADFDFNLQEADRAERRANNIRFFESRGVAYEETLVPDLSYRHHLRDLHPDIVFYQHPWTHREEEMPGEVAKYALTCYVPYFVPNYGLVWNDSQLLLHRQLWTYFCLNEKWVQLFSTGKPWYKTAVRFVATGHPMLDYFYLKKDFGIDRQYVIYAPHWSFSYPGHDNFENYSTFPKNGRQILDFAKRHPEIKWVFKPHPTLKAMLKRSGLMTEDEIEAYYRDWESIGEACYDGNYLDLFSRSRAMITDCGSFLSEYPCTGMPLIHLCSSNRKIETLEPSRKLFATFYQAHNEEEMWRWFDEVLVKRNDPKKDERLAAVREAGLKDQYAARNILAYLRKELNVR